MNVMVRCTGCGLLFNQRLGKHGFCCGHCRSGNGHGKNCTVTLPCKSCNGELQVCEGKLIIGEFYCCGNCSGSAGRRHGRSCIFRSLVGDGTEHGDRRSRSPRREMQRSRSSSLLRATQVNAASASSPSQLLCIICEVNACTMVGIPCGHLVLCQGCSLELERLSRESNEMLRCTQCRCQCTFHRVFPR